MEWSVLIVFFVLLIFIGHGELSAMKYKHKLLERKIDFLLERSGLSVDKHFGVPVQVLDAVKSGNKLKAMRLYREETGASLIDARKVIEELRSDT
ncbi:hypothetical protein ACXZ7R_04525 [Vibrio campbellii]|uniref:Uncharacterized protein n=1 Tax=Vibrio campbellii TaxID=680 RepID=A0ACC7R7R9_9VIBR|nr:MULTISPECIES: hypothetical protein [Vibrio]ARR46404.1 hypothetical protein CAY59_19195 [Vibrio campbellii]CAD7822170.1 hypothetical protein ACOMICROBIO_LMKGKHOH_04865 [Vibrio sp. B1FIG11]CAE6945976.1 hypothetical protein ACOMICROBIO_LMKGKHOH_04865 [Vibrio sp. B1FIG11]HDM8216713.1 hypothetical protein [Vibrio campbellii]